DFEQCGFSYHSAELIIDNELAVCPPDGERSRQATLDHESVSQ
ncbi:31863_t:CDS:1, partial [Racocetra persica]